MLQFTKVSFLCIIKIATTLNKMYYNVIHPLRGRSRKGCITFIGATTMDERILDAICVLPRIEMLCDYLNEEIDQLQELLRHLNADEFVTERICMRMRQLCWISEDISNKVYNDVNAIMGS